MSKRLTIHGLAEHGKTRCGLRALAPGRITASPKRVTCNRCRQIMGIAATWAQKRARELPPAQPSKRAVDAILGAAPVRLNGDYAVVLAERLRALERVYELSAELCDLVNAADGYIHYLCDIGIPDKRSIRVIIEDINAAVENVRKLKG